MLSIYTTTDLIDSIQQIINREDRLNELVKVYPNTDKRTTMACLLVDEQGIHWPIDWADTSPPYLIPTIDFNADTLLSSIFFRIGNNEKAWTYGKETTSQLNHFSALDLLANGYIIQEAVIQFLEEEKALKDDNQYFSAHNEAILRHYGHFEADQLFLQIDGMYQQAAKSAPNAELEVFTIKHHAVFLLDNGHLDKAENLLRTSEPIAISDDAIYSLKSILCDVLLKKLVVPYDDFHLGELKSLIWETLEYAKKTERTTSQALRLMDAAHIALISTNYSEGLSYLNKATAIFDKEGYKEFWAEAMRRKGSLLYAWAQDGNPQFFKSALDSYHEALKVYTREATPSVFADIHHNLGVIYAEIPTEDKKKGLMAGIALTSFQLALDHFTKEEFPYEYATICTNYGNALCKFPPAINSDNFEKAIFYYADALEIRTAKYPIERAITLLNYIEASWNIKDDKDFNEARYLDMKTKAEEVLVLVQEEDMQEEARKHLDNLERLKELVD